MSWRGTRPTRSGLSLERNASADRDAASARSARFAPARRPASTAHNRRSPPGARPRAGSSPADDRPAGVPVLVRQMRQLPGARLVRFLARRDLGREGEPAAPARRHLGRVDLAVIDDPAPPRPDGRIDERTLGLVVAVAELVLADEAAAPPGVDMGAPGGSVPPGEGSDEEFLEGHRGSGRKSARTMATPSPPVQQDAAGRLAKGRLNWSCSVTGLWAPCRWPHP